MRMFFSLVLLVCSLAVSVSSLAAEPTGPKIIPEGWLPALAPSIERALVDLREANAQIEMNTLSRHVADMTDAQLFIAYVRLYEKLGPKERAKLLEEQTAWLKKRPKAAEAGVESQGGSLAPLEANNAEVTYTERRLAELRARLKAVAAKKKKATDEDE